MKYLKSAGLLAITAAAMLASVGTASAEVTSSQGSTPTVTFTSTNSSLHGAFTTVSCQHTRIHKTVVDHNWFFVRYRIDEIHKTNCNFPVTVEANGTIEMTSTSTTGNGTVTSSGMKFTVHTSVGSCVFTTNNTHIGTLTGSNNTGGNAVLDITGKIPRTGGNFLCGSSGTWTASFTATSPSSLEVH